MELQGDYVEKLKNISEKMSCIFVKSETLQTTRVLIYYVTCFFYETPLSWDYVNIDKVKVPRTEISTLLAWLLFQNAAVS